MSHWKQHSYFPEEFLALQKELQHHPQLCENLANHRADDFELKMAEICAYCDVILDGDYSEGDFIRLSRILVGKLESKRVAPSIIVIN